MKHRWLPALTLCLVVLNVLVSREALAQTAHPLQLGAGYQFLHESFDRGGQSFPVGAYVEVEQQVHADRVRVWNWLGQFEGGFRSDGDVSEQIYTFLGGVRLAGNTHTRWTPSGFGLIGMATLNASCSEFCAGTTNGLAIQGGFAMTTRINASTLLDVTFKATKLEVDGEGLFNAAVAGGVRFNLSGR
jgi:hypothetical protein